MAQDNISIVIGDLTIDVTPYKAHVPEGELPVQLIFKYMACPKAVKQIISELAGFRGGLSTPVVVGKAVITQSAQTASPQNGIVTERGVERIQKRIVALAADDPDAALQEMKKIRKSVPNGTPKVYAGESEPNTNPRVVVTDGKDGFEIGVDKPVDFLPINYYIDPQTMLSGDIFSLDALLRSPCDALDFLKMVADRFPYIGRSNTIALLYKFLSDRIRTERFIIELLKVLHTARSKTVKEIVDSFCETGSHDAIQAYRKRAKRRLKLNDSIQDMLATLKSSGSIDLKAGYLVRPDYGYWNWDYFVVVASDGQVFTCSLNPREVYTKRESGELDRTLSTLAASGSSTFTFTRCEDKSMLKKVAVALGKRHPEKVLIMDEGK